MYISFVSPYCLFYWCYPCNSKAGVAVLSHKKMKKISKKWRKKRKRSRGLPPPSVLSSLFFSITARQGSNKDSNVFGKNLCCSWSLLSFRTCIRTMALQLATYSHEHANVNLHVLPFEKAQRKQQKCNLLKPHRCEQLFQLVVVFLHYK